MTVPEPSPPATVGTAPENATVVNQLVGQHLRSFIDIKNSLNQDRDFLAATDLKATPYYFSVDQETLIKSAILQLDDALDAVDMTFITRLIGLY
jgi:predicted transcriptional regulator